MSESAASDVQPARAHHIVLGNEKGGSGKSTTAMHIAVALTYAGFKVGVIDLDARQSTVARYLENRAAFAKRRDVTLVAPAPNRSTGSVAGRVRVVALASVGEGVVV